MNIRYLILSCILLALSAHTQENVWEYVVQKALSDPTISERTLHLVCAETSISTWRSILDLESFPDTEEWNWVQNRLRSTGLISPGEQTKELLENILYGSRTLHRKKAENLSMRFRHDVGELYAAENAIRETVRTLTLSTTWNLPQQVVFALTFCTNLDTSVEP